MEKTDRDVRDPALASGPSNDRGGAGRNLDPTVMPLWFAVPGAVVLVLFVLVVASNGDFGTLFLGGVLAFAFRNIGLSIVTHARRRRSSRRPGVEQ